MKLVRYGQKGMEKPGLIDSEGKIRDVSAIVPDAAHRAVLVELEAAEGAGRLLARITADAVQRLGLRAGGRVLALVKSMSVETLPG